MDGFKSYLLSRHLMTEKKAGFYLYWVSQFYGHCRKYPADAVQTEDIERYLKFLSKRREDWQVEQASQAIQLYLFHRKRKQAGRIREPLNQNAKWKAVAEDMRNMIKLMHRSYATEKIYLGWLRRFYRFVEGRPPHLLDSSHVKDFMTYLAVERTVGVSTQSQAFNAILFLFRHVLDKEIDEIAEAVRAKKKRRLPVVLSKKEIGRLFRKMEGVYLLMAQIIYGCGLRLQECL